MGLLATIQAAGAQSLLCWQALQQLAVAHCVTHCIAHTAGAMLRHDHAAAATAVCLPIIYILKQLLDAAAQQLPNQMPLLVCSPNKSLHSLVCSRSTHRQQPRQGAGCCNPFSTSRQHLHPVALTAVAAATDGADAHDEDADASSAASCAVKASTSAARVASMSGSSASFLTKGSRTLRALSRSLRALSLALPSSSAPSLSCVGSPVSSSNTL